MAFLAILLKILTVIGSALFMIFFFGMCVFIHEFGHFLAAKLCGLHIVAFSIGFKKIWAKKINGVEYRIGIFPIGGYVELPQIDAGGTPKDENGNELPRVAPWKRMVTAFAGPFFNVLFALFLGIFVWWFGLPASSPVVSEFKVYSIQENCPEYRAGMRPGDVIFKFNGKTFEKTWSTLAQDIMLNVGDVHLTVRKPDGSIHEVVYKPEVNPNVAPEKRIPVPFFKVDYPVIICPESGSPAEKAGLREGDEIISINGKRTGVKSFFEDIWYCGGKDLVMEYSRKGKDGKVVRGTVTVKPERMEGTPKIGVVFHGADNLTIDSIMEAFPAYGVLKRGDRIVELNKVPVSLVSDIHAILAQNKGEPLSVTVLRGEEKLNFSVGTNHIYQAGVKMHYISHPTPWEQMVKVINLSWRSLKSVGNSIGSKLGVKDAGYTTLGPQHFSGPIGIGEVLYRSVYDGSLIIGLNFVVVISLSLGLFNLLPLPVLDGGHIFFGLIETIIRRPISPKIINPLNYTFIVILLLFMLFVTFFDIKRLFPASPDTSKTTEKILTEEDLEKAEQPQAEQGKTLPEPKK